jgi:hypothetical protein
MSAEGNRCSVPFAVSEADEALNGQTLVDLPVEAMLRFCNSVD